MAVRGNTNNESGDDILTGVATIVAAMQSGPSPVPADCIPDLISTVAGVLRQLSTGSLKQAGGDLVPAVPLKKSIGEDYIVCLEDGKHLKMLKRYINSRFGLSPAQYRSRWGLPSDYPMTAPSHSKRRSTLAKENGLGRRASPLL